MRCRLTEIFTRFSDAMRFYKKLQLVLMVSLVEDRRSVSAVSWAVL